MHPTTVDVARPGASRGGQEVPAIAPGFGMANGSMGLTLGGDLVRGWSSVDPGGEEWFSGPTVDRVGPKRERGRVAAFTDALRGYAFRVHSRDGFKCRYCGLDGTLAFGSWLSLSWDHLLPKGHPQRDNLDYIVTACLFCNTADNRYFDLAEKRGIKLDGLTPDELVAQRLPYVQATRHSYEEFWLEQVVHPSVDAR